MMNNEGSGVVIGTINVPERCVMLASFVVTDEELRNILQGQTTLAKLLHLKLDTLNAAVYSHVPTLNKRMKALAQEERLK